jgi:hypothetical protein
MAAQFCMKCGKPLPAGAVFCAGCGVPVSGGNPPSAVGPTVPAAPAAPATPPSTDQPAAPATSDGSALRAALALEGCRNFLVQHQLLSDGRNYRVLNHEKRHLFTVKENVRQEMVANLLGGARAPEQGLHFGVVAPRPQTFVWTVADATKNPQGSISIQVAGNTTVSTLTDATGAPVLAVHVQRGMMGGLTATAAFPDGRAMLEAQGNLLRHNFAIHDASGAAVAKIHEAWASIRDTYNLDLEGNVDPLCALIFAILIDREKAAG